MKIPKILSVISMEANTGKTTFIEGIIPELTRRGYRVMTLKYSCHDFDIDQEGTDSYKHFDSGAHRTVIVGPSKCAVIERTNHHKDLYQVASQYNDVDLIVTEGFRKLNEITIEIIRKCKTRKLTTPFKNLLAVVSDTDDLRTLAPIYGLNDYKGICDLIENKILKRNLLNIKDIVNDDQAWTYGLTKTGRTYKGILEEISYSEKEIENLVENKDTIARA